MLAVPRTREGGLRRGEILLTPPYYSQRAVFGSPLSAFSFDLWDSGIVDINDLTFDSENCSFYLVRFFSGWLSASK